MNVAYWLDSLGSQHIHLTEQGMTWQLALWNPSECIWIVPGTIGPNDD